MLYRKRGYKKHAAGQSGGSKISDVDSKEATTDDDDGNTEVLRPASRTPHPHQELYKKCVEPIRF